MKRLPAALLVIALIVAGSWALFSGQLPGILDQSASDGSVESPAAAPVAAPVETVAMTVAHVHDGDTLFLTPPMAPSRRSG